MNIPAEISRGRIIKQGSHLGIWKVSCIHEYLWVVASPIGIGIVFVPGSIDEWFDLSHIREIVISADFSVVVCADWLQERFAAELTGWSIDSLSEVPHHYF